jgi:hypothetical protein
MANKDEPLRLFDGADLSEEQRVAFAELDAKVAAIKETGKVEALGGKKQAEAEAGAALLGRAASDDAAGVYARSFVSDRKALRRYLVAFKWIVLSALEAVLASVAWREESVPKTLPALRAHEACVATRYMEWIGHDRQGQPILLIRSRCADLEISREDRACFLTWTLEFATRFLMDESRGVERWCIIIDETAKEWKHTDNSFLSSVTPVVFSHYVERLNKAWLVNPGMLTSAAVSVVKLFLDDRTRNKFGAVHGTKVAASPTETASEPAPTPEVLVELDRQVPRKSYQVPELCEVLGAENVPSFLGGTKAPEPLDAYQKRIDAAWASRPDRQLAENA